jgi:uncharacterized protein (UPF0212 family)
MQALMDAQEFEQAERLARAEISSCIRGSPLHIAAIQRLAKIVC